MRTGWRGAVWSRIAQWQVAGAVAAVAMASIVYSQFDIDGVLSRDAAIYVYGGQRLTHGVPPYASIMDPKGPLSGILCGFGVAVARLFGSNDVLVVRAEFCALLIASVLGVYLLVLELWHSVVAGVVAAAVFTSFRAYAHAALAGPDGHTPGTVFLIFALWLTVRRQWYWAGFAASLAFLVWQPLWPYAVIAFACSAVWSPGRRLGAMTRCVLGGVTPLVALIIYYAAEGYPGKLFEGLFVFPLTGVHRKHMSIGAHLRFFANDVPHSYKQSGILLWIGLALFVIAAVSTVIAAGSQWRAALLGPMTLLLLLSLVIQLAYIAYDYIGFPHTYPLLPYAAAGFGAATAYLLRKASAPRARRVATASLLTAAAALTVACAVGYYEPSVARSPLGGEQAAACAIKQSLVPGTPLWVLGNPLPLVLLHVPNPDNYPYEGSGLDYWRIEHTRGGFRGWTGQIRSSGASVVVVDTWRSPLEPRMTRWLATHGYRPGFIGKWHLFVTPRANARMASDGIALAHHGHDWPLTSTGGTFTDTHCTQVTAG